MAVGGDCKQFRDLLATCDSWDVDTAVNVCNAESGGLATAYNNEYHKDGSCYGSTGLLQGACVHGYSRDWLSIPENNIKFACDLHSREGWSPWGACHDGSVDCGLNLVYNR